MLSFSFLPLQHSLFLLVNFVRDSDRLQPTALINNESSTVISFDEQTLEKGQGTQASAHYFFACASVKLFGAAGTFFCVMNFFV